MADTAPLIWLWKQWLWPPELPMKTKVSMDTGIPPYPWGYVPRPPVNARGCGQYQNLYVRCFSLCMHTCDEGQLINQALSESNHSNVRDKVGQL